MNEPADYITRCPACETSFRVNEEQLGMADGSVRCGACLRIFRADQHFVEPFPEAEPSVPGAENVPDDGDTEYLVNEYWQLWENWIEEGWTSGPEVDGEAAAGWKPADTDEGSRGESPHPVTGRQDRYTLYRSVGLCLEETGDSETATGSSSAPVVAGEDRADREENLPRGDQVDPVPDPEFPDRDLPAEMEEAGLAVSGISVETDPEELVGEIRENVRSGAGYWVACAVLVVTGILQYLWFNMEELSRDEEWRPFYLEACARLGCQVPEYRNLRQIATTNLVVRSHPQVKDALVVDVLLRNSGRYRQVFPLLELRFLDINHSTVALRRFRPEEYLAGEMRGLRFIPGSTEVRISLEIVDPGREALGYTIAVI